MAGKKETTRFSDSMNDVLHSIQRVFVGKEDQIRILLTGFFSDLHVLIEDIPGVGKTTLARCLALSTGSDFARIQFTPDLLPGDILGMNVWDQQSRSFIFKPGALMHRFILADELNRASPRTQSSLLEAMQEGQISVEGQTFMLPENFFVAATQNPSRYSGTFRLPEAELDRFGLTFSLGYPSASSEVLILERFRADDPEKNLKPVIDMHSQTELRKAVRRVFISDEMKLYLVAIAESTRQHELLRTGMSPRATQHLLRASQAAALMDGRDFIIPEDVQKIGHSVLSHRLIPSARAGLENLDSNKIISEILLKIPKPTGL